MGDWSDDEIDMLLGGVAAGQSYQEVAEAITKQGRFRSERACEEQFDRLRKKMVMQEMMSG
jgi:hypothetical protein